MKNIFHLDISTYIFFLISFFCGYFKPTIIIFGIVFFHELGHVIVILLYHYKIINVTIYPFGGITKIDKPINSSINKEIVISLAGIAMQCLLYLVFFALFHTNSISLSTYNYFLLYNKTILAFNMLPIIPLDGSITIRCFLEKFQPFIKSYKFYQLVSIIFFCLFLFGNYYYHLDNYFICLVLLLSFFKMKKGEKYIFNRFFLERYLHEYPYKKIQNHYDDNVNVLQKETRHFFYQEKGFKTEKEMLAIKKFKKTSN